MEPIPPQPPDRPVSDNQMHEQPVVHEPPPDRSVPIPSDPNHPIIDPIPEDSKVKTHSTSHDGLKSILTTVGILVLAPIIAFALTAFIFQSYQVDGSSMETTLQNEDRLIVLKLPRTWAKLTHHPYIPHRGDVIIFNKNDLFQYDGATEKKQLVKRVMGLPGDRVVVKDGKVTVYNSEHPNGFNPDATMPYGKVITTTPGAVDQTVAKDQVYVMGDNRSNSLDSRIFGPISDDDIVGKLEIRIFPFNKLKSF